MTWRKDEGELGLPLSAEYKEANLLRPTLVPYLKGCGGRLEVKWEGAIKESVEFDATEKRKLRLTSASLVLSGPGLSSKSMVRRVFSSPWFA